jgi:hypothetical protein
MQFWLVITRSSSFPSSKPEQAKAV